MMPILYFEMDFRNAFPSSVLIVYPNFYLHLDVASDHFS